MDLVLPRAAFATAEAYERACTEFAFARGRHAPQDDDDDDSEPQDDVLPPIPTLATLTFEVAFHSRPSEWMQVLTRIGRIEGCVAVVGATARVNDDDDDNNKASSSSTTMSIIVPDPVPNPPMLMHVYLLSRRAQVSFAAPPVVDGTNWLRGYYDPTKKAAKNKRRVLHIDDAVMRLADGRYFLLDQCSLVRGNNVP